MRHILFSVTANSHLSYRHACLLLGSFVDTLLNLTPSSPLSFKNIKSGTTCFSSPFCESGSAHFHRDTSGGKKTKGWCVHSCMASSRWCKGTISLRQAIWQQEALKTGAKRWNETILRYSYACVFVHLPAYYKFGKKLEEYSEISLSICAAPPSTSRSIK